MIFNCGPTPLAAWRLKLARLENWHPFFALWPRVVSVDADGNQQCAWLQMIERKGTFHEPSDGARMLGASPWWTWEYRLGQRDKS